MPDGWTSSPRDSRASGGWIPRSARDRTRRQPSASTMSGAREVAAVGVDGRAGAPVDLRGLELGASRLRAEQRAQAR